DSVSAQTKRGRVNEVLAGCSETLPQDGVVWRALGEHGIGHPGQYFLLRPDVQLAYIVDFARRLKQLARDERPAVLSDPWRLRDFADQDADEGAASMRHILLHLLHPENFERISSGEHKRNIITAFGKLVPDGVVGDDEALLAIRERLQELLGLPSEKVDYYE